MLKTALGLVKAIKADRKNVQVAPPCKAMTAAVIKIKTTVTARKVARAHKTTTMAVHQCQCMRTMVGGAAALAARAGKDRMTGIEEIVCRTTIAIANM